VNERDPIEVLASARSRTAYDVDPARLAVMLDRVTSPRARLAWLAGLRVRLVSAAAALTLLVSGAVLAFGTGAGLPALAIGPTVLQPSPVVPTFSPAIGSGLAATSAQSASSPITFSRGPGLSATETDAPVFSLRGGEDLAQVLRHVAGAFGVVAPSTGRDCHSTGGPGGVVTGSYVGNGTSCRAAGRFVRWTYEAPGRAHRSAGPAATQGQLRDWGEPLASALTPDGLSLGPATFDVARREIRFPLEAGGRPVVGYGVALEFNAAGRVTRASGETGVVSAGSAYPLMSAASAARLLGAGDLARAPAPSAKRAGAPTPGPRETLVSATVVYEARATTGGSSVLVPAYLFRAADGSTWLTLAVQRSHVKFLHP
jgi:hypothetical protein